MFNLNELGESDLNDLIKMANERLKKLTAEPSENIFFINGINTMRYARSQEKAKAIFQEEVDSVLEYIESDNADYRISIDLKKIKESDLYLYDIE